jgi:hypothetical protein
VLTAQKSVADEERNPTTSMAGNASGESTSEGNEFHRHPSEFLPGKRPQANPHSAMCELHQILPPLVAPPQTIARAAKKW